jgi:hypothetical protein
VAAGPLQRALVRHESRIDDDVVVPDEPRYAAVRTSPWAVDVGLAARLSIAQEGYLAVRGMTDPGPYLASGQFL